MNDNPKKPQPIIALIHKKEIDLVDLFFKEANLDPRSPSYRID